MRPLGGIGNPPAPAPSEVRPVKTARDRLLDRLWGAIADVREVRSRIARVERRLERIEAELPDASGDHLWDLQAEQVKLAEVLEKLQSSEAEAVAEVRDLLEKRRAQALT